MAQSNRVSIPKDLIEPLKLEAKSLLLTDNLTDAVNWVLRKYFRDKANGTLPNTRAKSESLNNYDDLFSN